MFAVNLKSLIYYSSFRLTKNICCSVFRHSLIEKQTENISRRYYSTKFLGHVDRKQGIMTNKTNAVVKREFMKSAKLKQSPIRWKTVLIVATFGTAVLIFFRQLKAEKLRRREEHRNKQIGMAKLGGKFELVDQDNKPVTSDDLLGNWLLIYFGFTHCPDICPDEIEKMVEVVDKIDNRKDIKTVKPVFITVDPERDTPSVVKKYLKEFSDKIIGLTGTTEQIGAVCKNYRVYFSPGPKDSDADYIVDHSIIMYLIDPEGKFMDYYGQNKNSQQIVDSIHFNQLKYGSLKSSFQKISEFFSKEKN